MYGFQDAEHSSVGWECSLLNRLQSERLRRRALNNKYDLFSNPDNNRTSYHIFYFYVNLEEFYVPLTFDFVCRHN